MLFFYGFVFTIASAGGSKKPAPAAAAPAPAAAPSTGGSDIPSFDSPEFATWLGTPGNLEKALAKLTA